MTSDTFSFKMGSFQFTTIADGVSKRDFQSVADLFPDAPRPDFLKALKEEYINQQPLDWSMNCLFVQTRDHNILVDTGIGPRKDGKSGQLMDHLKGISEPSSVDTVIITHCHGDHIGGLVNAEGDLTFPNADYLMQDSEWEHWMGEEGVVEKANQEYAQNLRSKLHPIQERIDFFKGKKELLPGIWSVPAPGHTPGHIGLLFESEGQTLLDLSDTLHTRVQFSHPDWSPRFDTDGKKAAQTRREMLTIAAEENHLTLFYHLAHPGLGTIQQKGEGFKWQPREGEY